MKFHVLCPRCSSKKTDKTINGEWRCHDCSQKFNNGSDKKPSADSRFPVGDSRRMQYHIDIAFGNCILN